MFEVDNLRVQLIALSIAVLESIEKAFECDVRGLANMRVLTYSDLVLLSFLSRDFWLRVGRCIAARSVLPVPPARQTAGAADPW